MSLRPRRKPAVPLLQLRENYSIAANKLHDLLKNTADTSSSAEDTLGCLIEQQSVTAKNYGLLTLSLKKTGSTTEADELYQH